MLHQSGKLLHQSDIEAFFSYLPIRLTECIIRQVLSIFSSKILHQSGKALHQSDIEAFFSYLPIG